MLMKTWKYIIMLSLLAAPGSPFVMPGDAAERPSIRAGKVPPIEVVRINPSNGDIRKALKNRKQRDQDDGREIQVHVVKLYVQMPPARAEGYRLYVGDQAVEEAGSFAEGIFVKVYEPEDLNAWRGKRVRFVLRDDVVDLGILIPGRPEQRPGRLPDLKEVLTGK
jgi:hypothetical protein